MRKLEEIFINPESEDLNETVGISNERLDVFNEAFDKALTKLAKENDPQQPISKAFKLISEEGFTPQNEGELFYLSFSLGLVIGTNQATAGMMMAAAMNDPKQLIN